jgi:CHAT domain-containing protein/tetratricopeptide (TPR) repeat protein
MTGTRDRLRLHVWTAIVAIAVWLVLQGAADLGSRAYVRHSVDTIKQALEAGDYQRAEALALEWRASATNRFGAGTLPSARAIDLLVEARLKTGKAGRPETVAMAAEAAAAKQRHLGDGDPDTALSVFNLAEAHAYRGDLTTALALHDQALTVRVRVFGPRSERAIESLERSAYCLIQLERFPEAEKRLHEVLQFREGAAEQSPLALARTLGLVGWLHRSAGSYAAAMAPLDRALAILRREASDHPDIVSVTQTLGDLDLLMGDPNAAQKKWANALEIANRRLGPEHPEAAELLRRLGLAAFSLGALEEGRRLRQQALLIAEASLAPCDPALFDTINDVALSLQYDGEYPEARALHRRIATAIQGCPGSAAADELATTTFNDAAVAAQMGDLAEAEALYEKAIATWTGGFGEGHPFVATAVDALASVVAERKDLARAQRLFQRALQIRRLALGRQHPLVAWTLARAARVTAELGNALAALAQIDEAIAIFRSAPPSDEPDHFAKALQVRSMLERKLGRPEQARVSMAESLSVRQQVFGESHPLVAESWSALASIDFARGAPGPALASALEAERIGRDHMRFTVRYLAERQALTFAARRPGGLDLAISVAVARPSTAAVRNQLLDTLMQSRRLVLDELVARSRAARVVTDSPAESRRASVVAAPRRFANLLVRSLDESVPRSTLDNARRDKDDAERALAADSADARTEVARSSIGLDSVRRALPPRTALVGYVQYARSIPSALRDGPEPVSSYAAFVALADKADAALVQLGPAAEIDRLISEWRREVVRHGVQAQGSTAGSALASRAAGERLRRTIWDPLGAALQGVTRIFVVPDGAVNLVALAALPVGDSSYVVEQAAPIYYLSAERDVVVMPEAARAGSAGMLALGGAAFDGVPSANGPVDSPIGGGGPGAAAAAIPAAAQSCGNAQNLRFEPLAGTLDEVEDLSRLWRSAKTSEAADVLRGLDATETTFKHEAHRYRVLHLATHGFFLGGSCEQPGAPFPGSPVRGVGGLTGSVKQVEDPFLLSGLALAGANRRAQARPDEDDGILTAEEVAMLDLQGVEWAVLSACDTGVGEVRAGEGVFGLRRAFQVAGARTVIMSLWSVDDRATRDWMRALYEGRFQRNLSTADAVHQASLAMLRDRRARGLSTHPFYWAAFVAAGDWR